MLLSRADCLDALAACEDEPDIGVVCGAHCRIYHEFTKRLHADAAWCDAYAAAAAEAATSADCPRVLVVGLGSGVPALAAARAAGCDVVWAQRMVLTAEPLEPVASSLIRANGVEGRVRMARVRQWSELARLASDRAGGRFAAVITEEVGDDPLADGLLTIARMAHDSLLASGGRFAPARLRLYGQLFSMRVTRRAGFDVGRFNALRSGAGAAWQDAEQQQLAEGDDVRSLSPAVLLIDLDLSAPEQWEATASIGGLVRDVSATVGRDGVLNSLVYWSELHMPSGRVVSLGPRSGADDALPPRPLCVRARRQRVLHLPYERAVVAGEHVWLTLRLDDASVHLDAPLPPPVPVAPSAALSRHALDELHGRAVGACVHWRPPCAPLPSYHFPMLADEARNGAFDRAVSRAIQRFRAAHAGRPPRVLDIGGGSGLLAMMAARAGAVDVHSVEMESELAALAAAIVAANGYAERVQVHAAASTELRVDALGGAAELLVCEVVDDLLLGEGVLPTVADARARLLAPGARIIPSGGALWALPVELLPRACGALGRDLDLSAFHAFAAASVLTANPNEPLKLQHLPAGAYRRLAPPVRLLQIDWEHAPLDQLAGGGESAPSLLHIESDGLLTALVLYFSLDLDGDDDGDGDEPLSTGPDSASSAWDQRARYLPVALGVRAGDSLQLSATYTQTYVRTIEVAGHTEDMLTHEIAREVPPGAQQRGRPGGGPDGGDYKGRPVGDVGEASSPQPRPMRRLLGVSQLVGHPTAARMSIAMRAPIAPTRAVVAATRAPRLALATALDVADPTLRRLLQAHGYVIITNLPPATLKLLQDCNCTVAPFLAEYCDSVQPRPVRTRAVRTLTGTPVARPCAAAGPSAVAAAARPAAAAARPTAAAARPTATATSAAAVARPIAAVAAPVAAPAASSVAAPAVTTSSAVATFAHPTVEASPRGPRSLRITPPCPRHGQPSGERSTGSRLRIPLERVGVHVEREHGLLRRVQLHLLADPQALQMVPWSGTAHGAVREALEHTSAELHTLTRRLLSALGADGAQLERMRAAQAAWWGDPSVFDALLYPNVDEDAACGMREHTDPGLLTMMLSSTTPGLQVRDRASGLWRDVGACSLACTECILFGGEALQFGTAGQFHATPHRVACAPTARVSTVFELRIHDVAGDSSDSMGEPASMPG